MCVDVVFSPSSNIFTLLLRTSHSCLSLSICSDLLCRACMNGLLERCSTFTLLGSKSPWNETQVRLRFGFSNLLASWCRPFSLMAAFAQYLSEVFVLCEKTEGKYFPVQTEQTRLIRHSLYGFWFVFFSVYSAVFVCRCYLLPNL